MIPLQRADLIRILPEIVLSGFAILIMMAEPFVGAERKSWLGGLALVGVVATGVAAVRTSLSPGLAFGGSVSADAFSLFEEEGILSPVTGGRFRDEVLARGGSRTALESFSAFRGRTPQIDALLRHNGLMTSA